MKTRLPYRSSPAIWNTRLWDHLLIGWEQFERSRVGDGHYECSLVQRCSCEEASSLYSGCAWAQTWRPYEPKLTGFQCVLKIEFNDIFSMRFFYIKNSHRRSSSDSNRLEKAFSIKSYIFWTQLQNHSNPTFGWFFTKKWGEYQITPKWLFLLVLISVSAHNWYKDSLDNV